MPRAFITGSGIRLGEAIARELCSRGYDLDLHVHRSQAGAHAIVEMAHAVGRRARVHTADLSDDAEVEALAAAVLADDAPLDAIVHNAALFEPVPFAEITRSQYRRMLGVNLDAPFFLTQRLLPALSRAPSPACICLLDIAADRPMRGYAHYSVSKAGLSMLVRALCVELAPHIRVLGVAPGTVAFPEDFDPQAREAIVRRIPLGREGTPSDVARAVAFLLEQPYLSGACLPVDGGRGVVL